MQLGIPRLLKMLQTHVNNNGYDGKRHAVCVVSSTNCSNAQNNNSHKCNHVIRIHNTWFRRLPGSGRSTGHEFASSNSVDEDAWSLD